ncbi:YitT family protein [Cohnella sp.]|uniref:YitT family protein n=1 Tax=Cohnella sp. TaxID=1883426 RepID=UPI00356582E5
MKKLRVSYRFGIVILGAILCAVGLELFLVPHHLIVGGVTGVSLLVAYFSDMRLGLFLFLLNLPFILFRYRYLDPEVRLITLFGLSILSLSAFYLHPAPALIDTPLAASVAGGIFLGLGIGVILRFDGILDVADGAVYLMGPHKPNRVGFMIWSFNGIIILGGGFVFGWDAAMHSVIAFALSYQTVSFSMNGFSLTRMAWISTSQSEEITQALRIELGKEVTVLTDWDTGKGSDHHILIFTIHRLELSRIKKLLWDIDPECKLSFQRINEGTLTGATIKQQMKKQL